ncbi:hypothetical protein P5V30_20695 [Mycobacteroides abscessus subsp. abscessus]|uniref:hypothetical protein n=1 Tax=Mycobacteroides abscessus TaxID=36809 RepID=UPI000928AFEE|nr:hypothetical protein [Mycobacteroides abscessus]MBE5502535.1 hypothetical protein [Mycobacteroides abscessus]MDO2986953.1 hypothetical protein [Mycobacteroides abscessus subsp. abscessus]SID32155.1 Uncharacterised protein [Mycobacteroides abscessus subsp. abscessus]SIJ93078.1 Uncharacterised protein [Mycobacteroides abscessus subsp. abscessus]SLH52121.1 Uncharacterised protein [Mycobacteroides abscessus subsp. massiliense]
MGSRPSALLHYGYDLGGGENHRQPGWTNPWNINELPDYEHYPQWIPAWIRSVPAKDVVREQGYYDLVEERLLAEIGGFRERFSNSDKTGYYDRRFAALERVGIQLSAHGYMPTSDLGGYILHIYKTSVSPTDPAYAVDFSGLERRRIEEDWDGRLDQAMAALQITCTKPAGWFLVSTYS